MKLEEKAALLSGKGEWQTWDFERLGIPSMYCSDGPNFASGNMFPDGCDRCQQLGSGAW